MRVLVVCTANVCRSPLAAAILRRRWDAAGLPAEVSSAGVRAMTAAPVCVMSQEVLGAPLAGAAREITPDLVREADLVLTMEREQRSSVVRLLPGSQARVFTVREAAALLDGLLERDTRLDGLRGLAPAMHALRGVVVPPADPQPRRRWWQRPVEPADPITIPDGHGLDPAQHRAALERVDAAAERVAAAVLALSGRAAAPTAPTP